MNDGLLIEILDVLQQIRDDLHRLVPPAPDDPVLPPLPQATAPASTPLIPPELRVDRSKPLLPPRW